MSTQLKKDLDQQIVHHDWFLMNFLYCIIYGCLVQNDLLKLNSLDDFRFFEISLRIRGREYRKSEIKQEDFYVRPQSSLSVLSLVQWSHGLHHINARDTDH